jgi:hypothetical protein
MRLCVSAAVARRRERECPLTRGVASCALQTRLKIATLEVLQTAEDRARAAERAVDDAAHGEVQAAAVVDAVAAGQDAVDSLQSVLENNTPTATGTPAAGALTHEDECVHALCKCNWSGCSATQAADVVTDAHAGWLSLQASRSTAASSSG